jgi:hypothetical protein
MKFAFGVLGSYFLIQTYFELAAMSTSLFETPPPDLRKESRNRSILMASFILLALVALGAWKGPTWYSEWSSQQVVRHFFTAVQNKDFEQAYGIWVADASWKQHPDQHKNYAFNEFQQDWGPGGEWGVINSFKIDGAATPSGGTGVVVVVTVNQRVGKKANIWVEKKDHSLTFSPFETNIQ